MVQNNIFISKVNFPYLLQSDIRCMKTSQPLQRSHCPSLKSTLSQPKQGFNCQGQLMRATSAPSNLQGQRQPVINCCVHKCKWVHWGSRGRKKTAIRPIFQQGAICERGKWFRGQHTNLLLCKTQRNWMWGEACWNGGGGCQECFKNG